MGDSKDVEAGIEAVPCLSNPKVTDNDIPPSEPRLYPAYSMAETLTWTSRVLASPHVARLADYGRRLQAQATAKVAETFSQVLATLRRAAKLCGLVLMLIFVVILASWFIALSHWFTVVFGHIVLRYAVPATLDDAFAEGQLDNTMIFAAIGALVVNLPPLVIFLLSFPLTFDRTVLEGSAAPANEFIKRITPKNRQMLLFMKYAPRLLAGPIGCQIFWLLSGDDSPQKIALDPLHAALAGAAGEGTLTALGLVKNRLLGKRAAVNGTDPGKSGEEVLPMTRPA
ncbi:hypothetical protein VTO73DRAFT_13673 [Trametes versicolor]